MKTYRSNGRLLRGALLFNATFSTLCAAYSFVHAAPLGAHFAGVPPFVFLALGAGLLLFAASLVRDATRENLPLFSVGATIMMDLGWVVGSVVLWAIFGDAWDATAVQLTAGVGAVVGSVAIAQFAGLAALARERDQSLGTTTRYEVTRVVDAPRDAMWSVVSDLRAIHAYAPNIVASNVDDDATPRSGVVRRCASRTGDRWAERVTDWNEGESLGFRFMADGEAEFPFPMNPMLGGWRLVPEGPDKTRVTVWWSFTTKPRWAGSLLLPMLDRSIRPDMARVIDSMAAATRQHLTLAATGA